MTGSNKSVRALFAALITTLLAVLMHVGAGGALAPGGVAIVFVLVLWVSMMLAGRRLGHLSLIAILGLGQVLMHLSMGWFTPGGGSVTSGGEPGVGTAQGLQQMGLQQLGHEHMGHATGSLDLGHVASMSHMADAGTGANLTMLLAHLGAVLITALILKRGEDIILTILQLALGPVASALHALAEAAGTLADFPGRTVHGQVRLPQAITAAVVGANYRRGPPALV